MKNTWITHLLSLILLLLQVELLREMYVYSEEHPCPITTPNRR